TKFLHPSCYHLTTASGQCRQIVPTLERRVLMITQRIWYAVAGLCIVLAGAQSLKAAEQVKVDVAVAKPYLLAGQKQTSYIRVGLTGIPINDTGRRTPVNVAIVLDKSGSMTGEKLRKAKDAALESIDRLGPN